MAKSNVWMSVSDLMTGLMVIFLFVAIAYIKMVQDSTSVLSNYVDTKTEMHDKLVKEFKGDTARWQMTIGKDLSMKFNNPTTLFQFGKADITPGFKSILDEFIPKYLNILLADSSRMNIQEIRIEGHTDMTPVSGKDPFLGNVELSQRRAYSVLEYIRKNFYPSYSEKDQKLLDFWFTANGLSYGKALDSHGKYVFDSGEAIDDSLSRRVEFRIVTSGEEILENFIKEKESWSNN